ncbi:hypothetical protein D3C78_1786360 [compost metagenome]
MKAVIAKISQECRGGMDIASTPGVERTTILDGPGRLRIEEYALQPCNEPMDRSVA